MRQYRFLLLLIVILTEAAISLPQTLALQQRREASRFVSVTIEDPSEHVAPIPIPGPGPGSAGAAPRSEALRAAWSAFRATHGQKWERLLDARSGAPLLVEGEGIPWIPGPGNTLASSQAVTLGSIVPSLREFVKTNPSLFLADERELVLNEDSSGALTADLWQIEFDRTVSGVPVQGDRLVFYIGHGNLIAFGAPRWSRIAASPVPLLTAEDAMARLSSYMGLSSLDQITLYERGTLQFTPLAPAGSSADSWTGQVGEGYASALTYRFSLSVEGEAGTWVGLVDARTGEVLALYDDDKHARVKGGVYPLSDDAICPDGCEQANYPMPFADLTIGASTATANSSGSFSCSPAGGTATTTLAGPYVRVVDSCGPISKSVTCDADLDLGMSAGTDCSVPAGASAGDTHAARSSFYHLNRIKEHARAWLPANVWLTQQLIDNVNINQTCNAFWSPGAGTVNFYRSGGGCRNTGEIAGVFLHEWGHGLDQNDGGGVDNPSEAYADITSFLQTHASCIGRGLTNSNCGGYGNACLACTGVRDMDWNQRANHAPSTPEGFIAGCPASGTLGPCGKEVHCEAYLAGETLWDLATRDLPAAGVDPSTAWAIVDRLWYKSRQGSGGNAYGCGATVSNRSCAATSWFTKLRTIDDDDGNLANGTPHAAAIFAAFNRHSIPCGAAGDASNQSTSSCPALIAPTVTPTPSSSSVALSWTAVGNAASYNVLRNDLGCSSGFTLIANVPGTTYTDRDLANGISENYVVQAVGANGACLGALSACQAVVPAGPHAVFNSAARVQDTCTTGGTGDHDGIDDAGEQIQFGVTIQNDGTVSLTGLTATVTALTAGVTMVDGSASYADLAASATGSSLAPHFTAQLGTGLACGATLSYQLDITANEGSWSGTFVRTAGQPRTAPSTVLSENFSGGIPGTWTVVDGGSSGGAARTWTTANPGGRTFTAPLASPVAIVDSDNAGNSATQDEQLITPILNLSAAVTVAIDFDEFFKWFNGSQDEKGDLDVRSSATGGAWVSVLRNQGGSNPPGATTTGAAHRTVDITPQAAGAPDVEVRFHYYNANFDWWWEIDNVVVTDTVPSGCNMTACTPAPSADLSITDAAGPDPVLAGQDLTFTVTVTNAGPSAASSVQLNDTTPAGTTFRSIAPPAGWSCAAPPAGGTGAITCTADTLSAGAPAVFTIVVKVEFCAGNGTVISNPVSVTTNVPDPDGADNSATAAVTVSDSGACNDGNACTQIDACQAGVCVGGSPVICAASDQCHDAGTCSPAIGLCSNPAKPDGAACNDASACSRTDSCEAGVCTGANPVLCTASDQCHDAGTCAPATGLCSNPAKPDGTRCDDGALCTVQDACSAGTCAGLPAPLPDEVNDTLLVTKSGSTATIVWSDGPGPFNVYRGLDGPSTPWSYDQSCLATMVPGPATDADLPAPGTTFYYLVSRKDMCGESIPGRSSSGTPIANPASCPP